MTWDDNDEQNFRWRVDGNEYRFYAVTVWYGQKFLFFFGTTKTKGPYGKHDNVVETRILSNGITDGEENEVEPNQRA